MELELQLQGHDATEATLFSLQDWIRQERLPGVQVQVKTSSPKPGEMGVEPVTILSVVLTSAEKVVGLVKSIFICRESRRPKLTVKLKIGEYFVEIEEENLLDSQSAQSVIDQVFEIVKESRR